MHHGVVVAAPSRDEYRVGRQREAQRYRHLLVTTSDVLVDALATVSTYPDQGQIAMKLMGFDHGVTLHGGLLVPVATCASGTAFDIVGRNFANAEGLQAAFDLAVRIAAGQPEAARRLG